MPRIVSSPPTTSSASQALASSPSRDSGVNSGLQLLSNTATLSDEVETPTIACPKTLGAKLLQPGFNCPGNNLKLVVCPKGTQKPTLNELRNEIRNRIPSSNPTCCDTEKCVAILLKMPNLDAIDLALEAQRLAHSINDNKQE